MVVIFTSMDTLVCDHSNESTEQYFHVVPFIILYKVVLTFKSVDETLEYDNSSESYWAVLSWGIVNHAVQGGS